METERCKVTPATAGEWLGKVPDFQRRRDNRLVSRIALAIRAGQWRENGATVIFNRQGELIDGQHRCAAIVEADRAVWMLVVKNVDATEATFQTIDDGKARAVSDFIKLPNANHMAAVCRMYWLVQNGMKVYDPTKPPIAACLKLSLPHIDAMQLAYTRVYKAARVTGIGSFLGFVWFYYIYILGLDRGKVDEFMDRMADGINLPVGSPIAALRNRCLNQAHNSRILRVSMMAMVVKAINAHLAGKSSSLIKHDFRETFPQFYGQKPEKPE